MRKNKRYFVSFSEGDSTTEASYVIMAIAKNVKIAKKILIAHFEKEKLPTCNYHTAKRIINEKILFKLSLRDVYFVRKEEEESDKKIRKDAEWKKMKEKIEKTPLEKESVETIFYDIATIS